MILVLAAVCTLLCAVTLGFALKGGTLTFTFWSWVAVVIFAVLGVAFSIQAYVIEPREAAKTSNANQPLAKEQPLVWIQGLHLLNLSPGQVPIVEVVFENTGPVPAYNFTHQTIVFPTDKPLTEDLPQLKSSTTPSKAVIPPNRAITQTIPGMPMAAKAIEWIKQGEVLLYVYGVATYDDGLSNTHTLKFCGYYFPSTDTFRACPFHNSSD
jgi:hypothetical protein